MGLTNAMATLLAAMALGETTTDFTNITTFIGVGDSATGFVASQTDLQASTNKLRRGMDAAFPNRTVSTAALNFRALFMQADANWAWQEWGVFNNVSAGTMFSRKVQSLGTKPSTEAWQLAITLTVTAA